MEAKSSLLFFPETFDKKVRIFREHKKKEKKKWLKPLHTCFKKPNVRNKLETFRRENLEKLETFKLHICFKKPSVWNGTPKSQYYSNVKSQMFGGSEVGVKPFHT